MKKYFKYILITFLLLGSLASYLAFKAFMAIKIATDLQKNESSVYQAFFVKPNEKNLPPFIKNFTLEEKHSKLEIGRKKSDIFDRDENQRMLEIAREIKPADLAKFSSDFSKVVMDLTNETKNPVPPSFEEINKFPAPPRLSQFREAARFWSHLSVLFYSEGNDNAAIIFPYACFYAARDLEHSYKNSGELIYKMVGVAVRDIGLAEIMRWVSRPKLKSAKLSKYLANDLLALIKVEYPLSRNIEYSRIIPDAIFNHYAKEGNILGKLILSSSYYKEQIDFFHVQPMKFIDKPYFECAKELKKYFDDYSIRGLKMSKALDTKANFTYYLFKPTNAVIDIAFSMIAINLEKAKKSHETLLARMEMASIALAYNSYFSEKNKPPKDMEELEKWFGKKFPINRLTGKTYTLNEEEGYVLYNKGFNDKIDSGEYSDDFYFKFITK